MIHSTRQCRRYRRHKALLRAFGTLLALASVGAHFVGEERRVFPFFAWTLFTRVHATSTDFTVELPNGPDFESLLATLPARQAASLYGLVQEVGARQSKEPDPRSPRLRLLRRRLDLLAGSPEGNLRKRRFVPLAWWRGEQPPELLETIVALSSSSPTGGGEP